MKKLSSWTNILLTLLLTASFQYCWAKKQLKSIGTVAIVDGEVYRIPLGKGQKIKLQKNSKLYELDVVETGKDSYIKILMKDDTIFDLSDSSKFQFAEFKMKNEDNKKDRKAKYKFLYGKMRSLFTQKAAPGKLKIETPDIVMGVRGTEILTNVTIVKKKVSTDIALLSGKLNIQTKMNVTGLNSSIDILKGQIFKTAALSQTKSIQKSLSTLSHQQTTMLKNSSPATKRSNFLNTNSTNDQTQIKKTPHHQNQSLTSPAKENGNTAEQLVRPGSFGENNKGKASSANPQKVDAKNSLRKRELNKRLINKQIRGQNFKPKCQLIEQCDFVPVAGSTCPTGQTCTTSTGSLMQKICHTRLVPVGCRQ